GGVVITIRKSVIFDGRVDVAGRVQGPVPGTIDGIIEKDAVHARLFVRVQAAGKDLAVEDHSRDDRSGSAGLRHPGWFHPEPAGESGLELAPLEEFPCEGMWMCQVT